MSPRSSERIGRTTALTIAFVLATLAIPARAQDVARVVLLTDHADARVVPLLRAELIEAGLEVQVVERAPAEITTDTLRVVAREHEAIAAFRVLVEDARIEVWLADRVTGKVVLREVLAPEPRSTVGDLEIALRALELLRASLLELEEPHPSRGEVDAPPAIEALVARPEDELGRVAVRVAIGILHALGGLDPGMSLQLESSVHLGLGVRLAAFGSLPLVGASIAIGEDSAVLRPWLAGGHVEWAPLGPRELFQPAVAIGAAALYVEGEGRTRAPRTPGAFAAWTFAPSLRVGLALAPSPTVHVVLTGLAAVSVRDVVVVFEPVEVARLGPLWLGASLGVELRWP